MDIEFWGALCFGTVIGWVVRLVQHRTDHRLFRVLDPRQYRVQVG